MFFDRGLRQIFVHLAGILHVEEEGGYGVVATKILPTLIRAQINLNVSNAGSDFVINWEIMFVYLKQVLLRFIPLQSIEHRILNIRVVRHL